MDLQLTKYSGCCAVMITENMHGVTHMNGSGEDDYPSERLPELYDELHSSGIYDGNVAVMNDDTGWCLSAHRDGRVVFERLGDRNERHMIPVSKDRTVALWHPSLMGILKALWHNLGVPVILRADFGANIKLRPEYLPNPTTSKLVARRCANSYYAWKGVSTILSIRLP
jgi:hypothetical protein